MDFVHFDTPSQFSLWNSKERRGNACVEVAATGDVRVSTPDGRVSFTIPGGERERIAKTFGYGFQSIAAPMTVETLVEAPVVETNAEQVAVLAEAVECLSKALGHLVAADYPAGPGSVRYTTDRTIQELEATIRDLAGAIDL